MQEGLSDLMIKFHTGRLNNDECREHQNDGKKLIFCMGGQCFVKLKMFLMPLIILAQAFTG